MSLPSRAQSLEAPASSDDVPGRAELRSVHLTLAIARGDHVAFAEFYEIWFDRAYALARSITRRDESFCLDVVQDCMMKVVRAMRALKTEAAVNAWMGKTLFSTAIDHLRRESRRQRKEGEVADASQADTKDSLPVQLEQRERMAWVQEKIQELPMEDRRLILERYVEGKTLAAVGGELGITGDVAHGRIRRILSRWSETAKEYFS